MVLGPSFVRPTKTLLIWRKGGVGTSAENFCLGKTVGHLGFTGTALWIEPETLAYGILLTNRTISGRISSKIFTFRKAVFYSPR